ncbi:protein family protein [Ancylostoma duodenale]|uniref:Protein family protein n=1 Tax=Ancylostoma duodenale TaxID=51022 RepID=A0A0C2C6B1_9BILA|nr:protein family protein [Ancylostoma duodenale]
MVRQTRASAKAEPEIDEEMDSVDIDAPKKAGPPASDASYERKFVIARGQTLLDPLILREYYTLCFHMFILENTLSDSRFYQIRHPKNRAPCLYRVNEKCCDEVVLVGEPLRSWFYGESVVSDGAIRLLSPVHPLFLALPYFIDSKCKFAELEEIISDSECPSIAVLLHNDQFLRNVEKVADLKDVCDTKVYRFNESKALDWISERFQRLRASLIEEDCLHKSIVDNVAGEVLDRYSFGILCDYLNPEMTALVKAHLSIRDPPADENERVDMSMKRKAEDLYEDIEQKPAKSGSFSDPKKTMGYPASGIIFPPVEVCYPFSARSTYHCSAEVA